MAIFGYTVSDTSGRVYRFQVDNASTTATQVNTVPITGNGDDLEGLGTRNQSSLTTCNVVGITESDNGAAADPYFSNINRTPTNTVGNSAGRIGNESGLAVRQSDGAVYNIQGIDGTTGVGPRTQLYQINPSTGAKTNRGGVINGQYADGLAITSNGTAYAADATLTNSLYRVNLTTGVFTRVGGFGAGYTSGVRDVGLDAIGNTVYMLAEKGDLYRVNTTNGSVTFLKTINLPQSGVNAGADYEGLALTSSSTCNPVASVTPNSVIGSNAGSSNIPAISSLGFVAVALAAFASKKYFSTKA